MRRNPITIEVLETLDAIDRRGTFAKAAEELDKATSAVSYTVQKLEEQLDVTLFQRQGRNSVLTAAGKLLLIEGREILKTTTRLAEKTQEVANGWEPKITIAIELLQPYDRVFNVIADFLKQHPTIEIDVRECVLNGGWEALESNQVDLIVGSPGPVPPKRGFRSIKLKAPKLIPVVSSSHELVKHLDTEGFNEQLQKTRAVVTHDTSQMQVSRSAGITSDGSRFYVQNIDQKVEAIVAGIGVGHLPLNRIKDKLKAGSLTKFKAADNNQYDQFMAWPITHKGQGLKVLIDMLSKKLAI